ncbi:hypothetical protein BKA70DRAFT_121865 [Coprinopsis sp. MPI-PUGE-AT-0042]|nr:hypothetical protein BKA70DRAFT_121865 [Coprinopsis sp. MPI-PUGE-AT-0042]
MAKSTSTSSKNAHPKSTPPITSFFSRLPSSSQGSTASTSASSRPRLKGEAATQPARNASQSSSNSKLNGTSKATTETLRVLTPSEMNSQEKPSPPGMKRERSATMQAMDKNTQPISNSTSGQCTTSMSHKKARLSSPISIASVNSSSTIPSSQSDEEELSPSQLCFANGKSWQKDKQLPTPGDEEMSEPLADEMDVDEPLPQDGRSGHTTPTSEWEIDAHLKSPSSPDTSVSHLNQVLTPPYTDDSSMEDIVALPAMPPTPVALDPATKTKQMIAAIKEKAAKKVQEEFELSSPEPTLYTIDLSDLSDSDSDDDALDLLPPAQPISASSSSSTQPRRSSRNMPSKSKSPSLPPRDGSPVLRTSNRIASASSSKKVSPPPAPKPSKTKPGKNPIEALLKDKATKERQGKGESALRAAAESLLGKNSMLDEMELEEEHEAPEAADFDYEKFKDMSAASAFGLPWDQKGFKIDENLRLDESDREQLFGKDEGKDINTILDSERRARQEEVAEGERGVELWVRGESGEMDVDVDGFVPTLQYSGNSETLKMLSSAVQNQEHAKAIFILKSGIFAGLNLSKEGDFLSQLCRLALALQLQSLSEAAFYAVLQVFGRTDLSDDVHLSSSFVTDTMLQLGAPRATLEACELPLSANTSSQSPSDLDRQITLYRLVTIVLQAAKQRRFAPDQAVHVALSLLLVGLDPLTTNEVRRDIAASVNLLSHRFSDEEHRELEISLVRRLVTLAAEVEPKNKAFLLYHLYSGTKNTLRMARALAYAMLTKSTAETVTTETYQDPAPLAPLLRLFARPSSLDALLDSPFRVDENTNYTSMKYYLQILSIAMSNVKGHVEQLKQAEKDRRSGLIKSDVPASPTKHGERKPETDLELLHSALERLHGEINDIRAAHLDRSRAKSVAKTIQFRIYYQRLAFERAWVDEQKNRTGLKSWLFAKAK